MTVAPTAVGNGNLALPYTSRPQSIRGKALLLPISREAQPQSQPPPGERRAVRRIHLVVLVGPLCAFLVYAKPPQSIGRAELRTRADLSGSELPSQLPYAATTTTL
jgi:hypothetical protein